MTDWLIEVRRAEIWLVTFDPAQGSEVAKTRPCVIVSNDSSNAVAERLGRGVVTVVPLTSNTNRVHRFQTLVRAEPHTGLTSDSKSQAEQVRALDVTRFVRRLGRLRREQMADVDAALTTHLSLVLG